MKILDTRLEQQIVRRQLQDSLISLKRYIRNTSPKSDTLVLKHVSVEFNLCFYVQGTCVFSQTFSKDRIIYETLTENQILKYIQGVVKHAST